MGILQIVQIVIVAIFALLVVVWMVKRVVSFFHRLQFLRFTCGHCGEDFAVNKKQFKEADGRFKPILEVDCPRCGWVVASGDWLLFL
jgi:hypothetical protein